MSTLLLNGSPVTSGYRITVYKFEPFSYVFTPTVGTVRLKSKSTLINSFVTGSSTGGPEVRFQSPSYVPWNPFLPGYTGAVSTAEQIVIEQLNTPSSAAVSYTINVSLLAGRFIVPILSNPTYTLYKNESVTQTLGAPIDLQAPGNLTLTTPYSVPVLPPGLSIVPVGSTPSLSWQITGTPLVATPASNYTIYGQSSSNPSFTVSKLFSFTIGPEGIAPSVTPSSNVSLTVGTAIPTTTIISRYPNSFSGNLSYQWSFLPDGLQFRDNLSNIVTSPFYPTDASSTLLLTGTPTVSAAQTYRNLGVSNVTTNILATRQTTPNITATQGIDLTFTETVLFDSVVVPQLYIGKPVTLGTVTFTANSYFPFSAGVASMTAASLPPGLTLSHTPGSSNAYLVGTPTTAVSATYSITATNLNGKTQTLSVPISVVPDTITFSGPVNDVCYNFVISRPIVQPLAGYYPSSIVYGATAASGSSVTFSVTNLSNVGITATQAGSNFTIGGLPDTITSLTTAVITATTAVTGATASRNMKYAILTDDVSITNPLSQMNFIQFQSITPVQFQATTLSERPIVSWSSLNLPSGLSLSPTGLLTGAPATSTTSGTFNVAASTGYISETNSFSYKTVADNALVVLDQNPSVTTSDVFSNVGLDVVAYSANPVTTFISNILPPQNPPITLSTNVGNTILSGDLSTAGSLYAQYEFSIYSQVSNTTIDEQKFALIPAFQSRTLHYILDASQTSDYVQPTPMSPTLVFPNGTTTMFKHIGPSSNVSNWLNNYVVASPIGGFGFLSDFAHSKDTFILVAGSEMWRADSISSSTVDTISRISGGDISGVPDTVGDYSNVPSYGVFTAPGPLMMSIATDRNSNWTALGQGFNSNTGDEYSIVRTSSNDGLTWTDVSVSTFVVRSRDSFMHYNNGRYFLAQPNSVYYADASSITQWSNTSLTIGARAASLAFSNNTILATDRFSGAMFVSSNNGTSWSGYTSNLPGAPFVTTELSYGFGTWVAAQNYGGQGSLYYSNAATTAAGSNWVYAFTTTTGDIQGVDYDGQYFFSSVNYTPSNRSIYLTNSAFTFPAQENLTNADNVSPVSTRRMGSRLSGYSSGPALISTVSNSTTTFTAPTSSNYDLFEYLGTGYNIPVQLTPSSNFIYYYALGLPQGLRLVLDASGIAADISGTPTEFIPEPRRTTLYAREPISNVVSSKPVDFRVLVPFILKTQGGASGYTAFLRQYAEVNGAQGARDSVALPVQEYPIGEFASPGAPDVVTQTVDPKCFSTSNCP